MTSSRADYVPNISLLFTELPYLDRPAAAAAAGFTAVESWWPFADPAPPSGDVALFLRSVEDAGVRLAALNFFAGDMAGGDRGVASSPSRHVELEANLPVVAEIARVTGVDRFNLLYGHRDERVSPAEQDEIGVRSIRAAVEAVSATSGVVLVEPLARGLNGPYPLTTDDEVLDLLERVGEDSARLLFDLFHLGSNGVDLVEAATRHAAVVGHVQIADSPGRGEPGSGSLPIAEALEALRRGGYRGDLGLEYKPTTTTEGSLSWMETL